MLEIRVRDNCSGGWGDGGKNVVHWNLEIESEYLESKVLFICFVFLWRFMAFLRRFLAFLWRFFWRFKTLFSSAQHSISILIQCWHIVECMLAGEQVCVEETHTTHTRLRRFEKSVFRWAIAYHPAHGGGWVFGEWDGETLIGSVWWMLNKFGGGKGKKHSFSWKLLDIRILGSVFKP